mgnify:CR=1 FL=1
MSAPADPLAAHRAQIHTTLAALRAKLDTLDTLTHADPIPDTAELEASLLSIDATYVKAALQTYRQQETKLHRQLLLSLSRTGDT